MPPREWNTFADPQVGRPLVVLGALHRPLLLGGRARENGAGRGTQVPRYEGVREVADHRPGRRHVPVGPLTGCRFDGGWGEASGSAW